MPRRVRRSDIHPDGSSSLPDPGQHRGACTGPSAKSQRQGLRTCPRFRTRPLSSIASFEPSPAKDSTRRPRRPGAPSRTISPGPAGHSESRARPRRSWFGEVSVDGGAGDAEFAGDVFDRVGSLPVGAFFFIHFPGKFYLARSEFGFLGAGPAPRPGCGQTIKNTQSICVRDWVASPTRPGKSLAPVAPVPAPRAQWDGTAHSRFAPGRSSWVRNCRGRIGS